MTKRMLIDATQPEETRVAIVDQNLKIEHLDIVHKGREPLKGNIYLAKVRRIEPSLQAAFVEYDQDGEKRHGFLSFAEIHPDYFRLPTADREALRAALARIEAKTAEAVARGESLSLDAIEAAPVSAEAAATFAEIAAENGVADDADEPEAPRRRDPLQPIDLYGDDEAPRSYEGFGGALQADGFHDSFAPMPAPANDAPDGLVEDDFPASDEDSAAPVKTDYETVGGGASEDELEEQRRRVRQKFLRNYRIQEVIKRGQVLLIQVVKEERGNKGAALTTYLSLAGRYCVLMPNSDRSGGVSRKISNPGDRRRLKETLDGLDMPDGVSVILRTAGVERSAEEIRRDYDYLSRVWDQIRAQTMKSTAPALIYEEANLIKRAIRDHVSRDVDGVVVEGAAAFGLAKDFIKLLMPSHEDRVVEYKGAVPLFARYQVEAQIDKLYEPVVQLKSGGYLVINPTEALVSIDVNSGRATRDRHIEETALRTNMEAAEEVARQLRLRDLAGLVVIDFIDMEEGRHNASVERKLKEAMRPDRARLQIGRISGFGLMELSRQRLRPSLLETNFEPCPHCAGTGHVRSADSAALSVLRAVEEEGLKGRAVQLAVDVPTPVALYLLNEKREQLGVLSDRYDFKVYIRGDETLQHHEFKLDRLEVREGTRDDPGGRSRQADPRKVFADSAAELNLPPLAELTPEEKDKPQRGSRDTNRDAVLDDEDDGEERGERQGNGQANGQAKSGRNRRTRGGGSRSGGRDRADRIHGDRVHGEREQPRVPASDNDNEAIGELNDAEGQAADGADSTNGEKRGRRGRRGGRRRGPLGMRRERGEREVGSAGEGEPAFAGATVLEIDTTPRPLDRTGERNGERTGGNGAGNRNRRGRGGNRDNSRDGSLHGTAHVPAADGSETRIPVHGVDGLSDQPEGTPQPAKTGWWRRWTGA